MTIHEAPVADRGEAGGPADQFIAEVEAHTAHNYHPLPVVLARGEGAWVEDVAGKRYLDMLAGYSALNFGHCNPVLVAAAERQLGRLTLTSRAFHNDLLGVFGREQVTKVADRLVGETSLGQQQRVAVARGLIGEPAVLVADEPISHQDAVHAEMVMSAIAAAVARGTACVLAGHDPLLARVATRVLRMEDGRLA